MSRLLVAALTALALLTATAVAQQQPTHRELAEKAVAVGYEHQMAAGIMAAFWPVAVQLIQQRAPQATELQKFQYKGKTTTFAGETAKAALVPLVDLFDRGFTDEELVALIAFYESPVGQKLGTAQLAIEQAMAGPVGASLKTEIMTFQHKIEAMLAADGY
jgi:hypothetical protein